VVDGAAAGLAVPEAEGNHDVAAEVFVACASAPGTETVAADAGVGLGRICSPVLVWPVLDLAWMVTVPIRALPGTVSCALYAPPVPVVTPVATVRTPPGTGKAPPTTTCMRAPKFSPETAIS